ncbi:MAG: glycosyltransferase family 2 protein [Polyangiaceae bacterium]|nr:glycosyltransferase family 2 protein [Polyangiaceae bacterium]
MTPRSTPPFAEAAAPAAAGPEARFSVIVPCYNEEGAIGQTVAALRESLAGGPAYELIVVNDGSADASAQVLGELVASDPALRVLTHTRNRGYGAALKTGILRSRTDLIVITDADGTYPNHRMPELIAAMVDHDMVVGARTADDVEYPLIRRIPKAFLRRYAGWLAGQEIPDMNSGMRVFRKDVAERFLSILPDGFSFTTTITLAMLTNHYAVKYVPIGYSARIGKSKIRPIRDTLLFLQLIVRTGVYFAPLRFFAPVAVVLLVASGVSAFHDVFILRDMTESTLILLMFAMNTLMVALLADMIDKRSGR